MAARHSSLLSGTALLAARALLAALAVLVSLVIAESVARHREQKPWWDSVVDEQLGSRWQDYPLNSQRLRDREYLAPRPPGTYRILLLGDSFTFGSGVVDRSKIFAELVEQQLDAEPPDPKWQHVEVLNAGIPGSLTDQWAEAYRRVQGLFQPQCVVVVFFLRDGTRLGLQENFFGPLREKLQDWREHGVLARRSALWRTLRGRVLAREVSSAYIQAFHDAYLGDESETEEWRAAQNWLCRLRDDCKQQHRALHLVVFPVLFGLRGEYPFQRICDEIESFAAREQISSSSLLPAFLGRQDDELWVSPADQHPNELGHRIAAEAIERSLRSVLGSSEAR